MATRHLAIYARDPEALAAFYQQHFQMDAIMVDPDGYLTFALLKLQMARHPWA
ncbi:hypothetical protein GT755_30195 [Herbidospora sp. NEAU-GS84]|uniref:Glyoxalase/fosfomycin resistance/dioxygenase domain-containing protein n=1 Tax=Herbidospora solisilvae TaxID=2696284 RepID=A0A7C9NRY5_9ACTN|nr:hypothetical protein [Herbidospora solisilvae]